jgi:UDP-glucose 4-epimerase
MEVASGMRKEMQVFGNDYPTEDGTGVRDYVHVTDLAIAHVLAADYLMAGKESLVVNLGSEQGLSVQEIIDSARKITGSAIATNVVDRRLGDPAKLVASSALAKDRLGWEPRLSSVDSIIETTWRVYEATRGKNG